MDPVGTALISATAPIVASELMKDSAASSKSKTDKWMKWALLLFGFYLGYKVIHQNDQR